MKFNKKSLLLSVALLVSASTPKVIIAEDTATTLSPATTTTTTADYDVSSTPTAPVVTPVAPSAEVGLTTEISTASQSEAVVSSQDTAAPVVSTPTTSVSSAETVVAPSTTPVVEQSATTAPTLVPTVAPTAAPTPVSAPTTLSTSQQANSSVVAILAVSSSSVQNAATTTPAAPESSASTAKQRETVATAPSIDISSLPTNHTQVDLSQLIKVEEKRETKYAEVINHDIYSESFEVKLKNQTKKVKKFSVAVWSAKDDQDDLKWLINDGSENIEVNLKDFNMQAGLYNVNIYIDYEDGTKVHEKLGKYELRLYNIQSKITEEAVEIDLQHKLEKNVYAFVAVWSDKNGKDDIKWFHLGKDGKVAIPNETFSEDSDYRIHTYVKQKDEVVASRPKTLKHTEDGFEVTTDKPKAKIDTTSLGNIVIKDSVAVEKIASNSSGNFYPVGQCTWGAKAVASWASNSWGNGGQWALNASREGFLIGTTPVPGALASWDDGGYGHVAYVTAVESTTKIRVVESNVNGDQNLKDHRGWFDPTRTSSGPVLYIYPVSR